MRNPRTAFAPPLRHNPCFAPPPRSVHMHVTRNVRAHACHVILLPARCRRPLHWHFASFQWSSPERRSVAVPLAEDRREWSLPVEGAGRQGGVFCSSRDGGGVPPIPRCFWPPSVAEKAFLLVGKLPCRCPHSCLLLPAAAAAAAAASGGSRCCLVFRICACTGVTGSVRYWTHSVTAIHGIQSSFF